LVDVDGTRYPVTEVRVEAATGVLGAIPIAVLAFVARTLWPDADGVPFGGIVIGLPVVWVIVPARHWRMRDVMITVVAAATPAVAVAVGFRSAGLTASPERWADALAVLVAVPVGTVVAAWLVARHERRMARPPQ
jgi:uncharacterized membrane protein YfcA